jgi:RNA polymerase sigma factor (sigma-70 family)
MAANALNRMILHLRRASRPHEGNGLTDGDLLERYVSRRDPGAFEILLRRHGPMVWGVCRRILRSEADSEDAFQTTFLVFIRKAGSIRSGAGVGNWLYGVAHNTALKARALRCKRESKELEAGLMPRPQAVEEVWQQVQVLLDAELSRLPDKYRIPIVLCGLEGKTIREAARQLGWPQGTVATRLARGRALLAGRLSKHGLELTGGVLAALLLHNGASASPPVSLVSSTVSVAKAVLAGIPAPPDAIPAGAANLTQGVLRSMFLTKMRNAAVLSLAAVAFLAVVGTGIGMLAPPSVSARQPGSESQEKARPEKAPADDRAKEPKPAVIADGEPVWRMALSPDGKLLATVSLSYDSEEKDVGGKKRTVNTPKSAIKLWEAESGSLRLSLGEEKGVRIESLAFSPDGKTLAVALKDSTRKRAEPCEIRLIDAGSGNVKKTISYGGLVRRVMFSADGKNLFIAGQYVPTNAVEGPFVRTVLVWDLEKDKAGLDLKQELGTAEVKETGTADGVRDLALSPDGKLLAAADADWKVRLLNVTTGELQKTLDGHTSVAVAVAFSPDGKTLASGSPDGTARAWDTKTGKEVRTLKGNQGAVAAVAFSPDGKFLATGGGVAADGKTTTEAILWNAATGELVKTLPGEKGSVSAIAFSPDGKILAVGRSTSGKTGEVKVWTVKELFPEQK